MFAPSEWETAVGSVTSRMVLGSCVVLLQCRAFCLVLHIAFFVPAVLGSCDVPLQCRAFCFVLHFAFAVPAVLGSCDVPLQCRAFCFVLHIAFAVPAEHKGGHLNLHMLIFTFLFFHHKKTKGPFREAYQVAGHKQNVFSLWCYIYIYIYVCVCVCCLTLLSVTSWCYNIVHVFV